MIVIDLPFPISVNAMYADGKIRRHKSQRYADWCIEAGWVLKSQRVPPILGQVEIKYELQDGLDNRKRDCFNFEKGVTDLLVHHGIIQADDNTVLRKGSIEWTPNVKGVRITISSHRVPETIPEQMESADAGIEHRP